MSFSEVLELLTTIATCLGIPFVAYQIWDGKVERKNEDKRVRQQATLEYARQTLDARHKDWGELPDDYDQDKIKIFIQECLDEEQPGPKLEAALGYLNLMETLCIGAKKGIYEDATVFELYGERIRRVSDSYSRLIEWRRDKTDNPNVYIGLTEGADRFRKLQEENAPVLPIAESEQEQPRPI